MLEDKIAIVTGGASGMGRAIAQALAGNGANLVIADIDAHTISCSASPAEQQP